MFDLVLSTSSGERVLKEEESRKLCYSIVNQSVKSLDKDGKKQREQYTTVLVYKGVVVGVHGRP